MSKEFDALSQIKSAEGRNFGTCLNSTDRNSNVFSNEILPQKNEKFTEFLRYECIVCKTSMVVEKAVVVDDGWACVECFQRLAQAVAANVLKIGDSRTRKVTRLYGCFGCGRNFTTRKMSNCLAICRKCFLQARSADDAAERKLFIEKTLKEIGRFLRRRI